MLINLRPQTLTASSFRGVRNLVSARQDASGSESPPPTTMRWPWDYQLWLQWSQGSNEDGKQIYFQARSHGCWQPLKVYSQAFSHGFFVGLRFSPPGFHQSLPKCIPDMATSDPKARENQRASETKNMGFLWPNLRNDISSVKAQKANQSLVYTQREKILQGWEYQGVGIIEDQFRNCWAQKFWVKQY